MKKLAELAQGARFLYGGVEWVILENDFMIGATLAISAEPVFNRAFDAENRNDWRVSSLRRELNGPFLDALIAEGADPAAFVEWESDLTADDGMTDYEAALDKIALISCEMYREYRALIPKIGCWWWTLTPWTCDPEYSYIVRYVYSSGAMYSYNAYYGYRGVRPLCYLQSSILVSVPDEEGAQMNRNEAVEEARDAVLDTLNDYPADIWGDVLSAAVASLFQSKQDAEEIAEEEKARREISATETEPPEGVF